MKYTHSVIGSTPAGPTGKRLDLAFTRSLRTLLQGLAAALPSAGAGSAALSVGYWTAVGYSCLGAVITAAISLLQNLAAFLPDDPTQARPEDLPQAAPSGALGAPEELAA